jgi:hypothetical protein
MQIYMMQNGWDKKGDLAMKNSRVCELGFKKKRFGK